MTEQVTASDLTAWLSACYDERERQARAATPGPWIAVGLYELRRGCRCMSCYEDEPWAHEIDQIDGPDSGDCVHPMHIRRPDAEFIAAHDPTWRLADVAVKRAVLAECLEATRVSGATWLLAARTIRLLASEFAGEPGYLEEWST